MEINKSFFGSLDEWIDFKEEPANFQDQESLDISVSNINPKDGSFGESNSTSAYHAGDYYNVHGTRIPIPDSYH